MKDEQASQIMDLQLDLALGVAHDGRFAIMDAGTVPVMMTADWCNNRSKHHKFPLEPELN